MAIQKNIALILTQSQPCWTKMSSNTAEECNLVNLLSSLQHPLHRKARFMNKLDAMTLRP
jgi:hypothetical protein